MLDDFYTEEDYRFPTPDYDYGGGSGFGNTGYIGIPDGSIFEGMIPGVLAPASQAELDAVKAVVDPSLWDKLKGLGSGALKYLKDNPGMAAGLLTGGGALLGALSKAPPSGGGVGKAYAGPAQQLTRTVTQGKYGPIAQHSVQAARGGIMQAYAQGGAVPIRTGNQLMEDGGFVMTKRAVDGAGGPQGIRQVLPQAQLFQGPGDGSGRDDRIKTGIRAADGGITPALVSKNEMYVPRRDVHAAGGPRKVHALMKRLERRA